MKSSKYLFDNVLVIGLGLIGGSIAKSIRHNKISNKIFAYDSNFEVIEKSKSEKIIDNIIFLDDELKFIDLIIIATPISHYDDIFKKIRNKISLKSIVIDVGSIKDFKIKNLPSNFLPCHPIAGSDKNSYNNSCLNLFKGKNFIICKEKFNDQFDNLNKIIKMVEIIGSKPVFLEAKNHDIIFGLVSHLPQFISFLTKDFLQTEIKEKIDDNFLKKCFRLDNSNPDIWIDIFKNNKNNLERFYQEFFINLQKIIVDLENKNWSEIKEDILKNKIIFNIVKNNNLDDMNDKFFIANFTPIFFRFLVCISYLKIKDLLQYLEYSGSGFTDFSSISSIAKYESAILDVLIKKNIGKIKSLFTSISK